MWGVFDVEQPYECTPLAMFCVETEAVAWIAWCRTQNEANADDRPYSNVDYYQAIPMRNIQGEAWNSYDPLPDEDLTPMERHALDATEGGGR